MALAASFLCLYLTPAFYQDRDEERFYGKVIFDAYGEGFDSRKPFSYFKPKLKTAQKARRLDPRDLSFDVHKLWETGLFEDIGYRLKEAPVPDQVIVIFVVRTYPRIREVRLIGAKQFKPKELYENVLRLQGGDVLDEYRLTQDEQRLVEKYRKAGYHFAEVRHRVIREGGEAILIWEVFEGPLVQVDEIRFTGTSLDEDDLRTLMVTTTTGLFRKAPFYLDVLREDLERIKLYLRLQGYLDIYDGERVFLRDLRFNEARNRVQVTIHVEEGPLYTIGEIRFEGNTILSSEELLRATDLFTGRPFSERDLFRNRERLRDKYGEYGRINVKIDVPWFVVEGTHRVNIIFRIREGEPVKLGRILIQGNSKTRERVIRLDLREDVVPGEPLNTVRLNRAIRRLKDRGWFEFQNGVQTEFLPGPEPNVRDLRITVAEGRTARIQFAAGFSSAFGLLGLIEYTQRNFDLADLPGKGVSLADAFSGGGQTFSIRLAPGADRQTYSVNFHEPYFFGSSLALGMSAASTQTVRESWNEDRRGGYLNLTKRWDQVADGVFSLGFGFRMQDIRIGEVEPGAPASIAALEGGNKIVAFQPSLVFDNRDSVVMPTQGLRLEVGTMLSWTGLGSDFDFLRSHVEFQFHFRTYETASRQHHFVSTRFFVGRIEPFGNTTDIPIFERFFAGGRGTIRGFDFRGVGPRESGDPVGGNALVFSSVEYTVPLFQNTIFGAIFLDSGTLVEDWSALSNPRLRTTIGVGLRFIVPTLGNIPISLDFGFALHSEPGDDRQVVLFDLGRFF